MNITTKGAAGEAAPLLVTAFVSRLRLGGAPVSTSEVLDAIGGLRHMDLSDRSQVRGALRATLVKDVTYEVLFRRSFDAVFPMVRPAREKSHEIDIAGREHEGEQNVLDSVTRALREGEDAVLDDAVADAIEHFGNRQDDGRSPAHHAQRLLRRMNVPDLYRRYVDESEGESAFERNLTAAQARAAMDELGRRLEDQLSGILRAGGCRADRHFEDVQDRPLLRAGADELAAMRQAMRPIARRLAVRVGARRRSGGVGLDMRRTIRASMGTGGVPVRPALQRRRPGKPDLMVLCDVSGSTAQFAPFTLTLLHAVHQEFRRVRSFVFIDGVVEITDLLESSPGVLDPHHLLSRRGLVVRDGRSDYAHALTTFLMSWGDAVTAKTTLIVAGDARSHEHASATSLIADLRLRARRLYWLNPEPRPEWDTTDSRATEYAAQCTEAFEVSTIRQLGAAVTRIV